MQFTEKCAKYEETERRNSKNCSKHKNVRGTYAILKLASPPLLLSHLCDVNEKILYTIAQTLTKFAQYFSFSFPPQVYIALFKPLRVSRRRFKKILSCLKIVRKMKCQEIYVQEKITKVDSLSLVLSGK